MFEYRNNIKLNMSALNQAVCDYFYNEEQFRLFLRKCEEDRSLFYDRQFTQKDAAQAMSYGALRYMCDFVGLDVLSVLSVFKAIRRNSQYKHNWGKEAHFSNDRYFEFEDKRPGSIESFCDLCKAEV